MEIHPLHSWDLTTTEARELQRSLAGQVDTRTPLGQWSTVAAADVSWDKKGKELYAAVVVVRAESFELVERVGVAAPARFPYVPGLLSFREAPALLAAFARLNHPPDVVFCDGHGYAHPRRFGVTCHLGLWLKRPTVGVAKSVLCGTYEAPGLERGDRQPLIDDGEVIGAALRTRSGVNPLFVSAGHLCDLDSACAAVLATTVKYRLPVPSRLAHAFGNQIRTAANAGQPLPA
jgi:deoxyribonuclease V